MFAPERTSADRATPRPSSAVVGPEIDREALCHLGLFRVVERPRGAVGDDFDRPAGTLVAAAGRPRDPTVHQAGIGSTSMSTVWVDRRWSGGLRGRAVASSEHRLSSRIQRWPRHRRIAVFRGERVSGGVATDTRLAPIPLVARRTGASWRVGADSRAPSPVVRPRVSSPSPESPDVSRVWTIRRPRPAPHALARAGGVGSDTRPGSRRGGVLACQPVTFDPVLAPPRDLSPPTILGVVAPPLAPPRTLDSGNPSGERLTRLVPLLDLATVVTELVRTPTWASRASGPTAVGGERARWRVDRFRLPTGRPRVSWRALGDTGHGPTGCRLPHDAAVVVRLRTVSWESGRDGI